MPHRAASAMLSNLVAGLIVAAITGITFVAYRHVKAFRWLYRQFSKLVTIVFVGFFIWQAAIIVVASSVLPLIPEQNREAVIVAMQRLTPFQASVSLPFIGALFYTMFLYSLPYILGLKDEEAKRANDDKDDQKIP